MVPLPRTVGDFQVLPIVLPKLPSFPKEVVHHVYLRRNSPKIPTADDSRSLFLTNVPVDSTEAHFRALFARLVGNGRFESIVFEDDNDTGLTPDIQPEQAAKLSAHSRKRKREDEEVEHAKQEEAARLPPTWSRQLKRSGSTAVVLLADERSVKQVLKAVKEVHQAKEYPEWGAGVDQKLLALGSQWLKEHNQLSYPDKAALQSSVDSFFTVFNRKEQEAAELAKRLRNEPDEDGFVTVTRGGGRAAPARRDEAEEAKQRMLDKQDKKKSEMPNFYRFQTRERKKAEQAELIKRFEEDRKKVNAMKEKRGRFRPET